MTDKLYVLENDEKHLADAKAYFDGLKAGGGLEQEIIYVPYYNHKNLFITSQGPFQNQQERNAVHKGGYLADDLFGVLMTDSLGFFKGGYFSEEDEHQQWNIYLANQLDRAGIPFVVTSDQGYHLHVESQFKGDVSNRVFHMMAVQNGWPVVSASDKKHNKSWADAHHFLEEIVREREKLVSWPRMVIDLDEYGVPEEELPSTLVRVQRQPYFIFGTKRKTRFDNWDGVQSDQYAPLIQFVNSRKIR